MVAQSGGFCDTVRMIIEYANKHRWYKTLQADPLEGFGENSQARIKSTLKKVSSVGVVTTIQPLTKELLAEFLPIYKEEIDRKDNPKIFDVEEKTLGSAASRYPYFYLSLHEKGAHLGGTIFAERPDALFVSYRAYRPDWQETKLQAKPALYAEYITANHAVRLGKSRISHGRDRNPYGLNANIGLAAFKLAIGCRVYMLEEFELNQIDTDTIETDALVLQYPGDSIERISKAFLITTKNTEHKWLQVTKYPQALEVETIYR